MTIDELKNYVRTMLNAAFPTVTIQFEHVGDDPLHIGVSVYGVEASSVKWVKERILEIDEKLCADGDFALTPLVRDEATTEKFYPQFSSPWKWHHVSATHVALSHLSVDLEAFNAVVNGSFENWKFAEPICSNAANEELALAA